ncbi:WD40_repeat protein [Hexamita inflata]|uniref:Cilia- and flagella-associated protein 52 n=1 Tax=Hexamita inflata TaxID=28002 RepID=A0AA86PX62_9EUKA|nr:WD40 repeat protein [Hexamita inflata]
MSSLEDLLDTPQIQFNTYLGFGGHLTKGLHLLPNGQELVYAAGNQIAFLRIQEKPDKEKLNKVQPLTRRVGGGAAPPRQRAFGGTTNAPQASRILTSTQKKPVFEEPETLDVPPQEDNNIIVPGSLVRPVLVSGHKYPITAMSLSASGKYLISGTQSPVGAPAEIIVWDVEQKKPLNIQKQHKGSITDIVISPDESFFVTLGEDNLMVVYPISAEYHHPLYTPLAGRQFVTPKPLTAMICVNPNLLIIGGDDFLTFVSVDLKGRTLSDNPVRVPIRRRYSCFKLVGDFVYGGTEQGDVLKIDFQKQTALQSCPSKKPFVGAVTSIVGNDQNNVICSTTAGRVYLIRTDTMTPVSSNEIATQTGASQATATTSALQLSAASLSAASPLARCVSANATGISCMATCENSKYAYAIGPNALARVNKSSLESRLLQTAPPTIVSPAGIQSLSTPIDTSRIYVSGCGSFVSVWSSQTGVELLRINVPNVFCNCVQLTPDGSQIISAWSDGCLRSFAPQSGKTIFCLQNVHAGGVTAFSLSRDGAFCFTGGEDSKVCVVDVCTQQVLQVCSGHRGRINSVTTQLVANNQQELVTGCQSGFVQHFHIIQQGNQCQIKPIWNSRAEGDVKGCAELEDGSQVIACGSGGLTWFSCGKNAGAVVRALPLVAGGTSLCKEERGDVCKIVIGCADGHIFVVDWDTGKIEKQLCVFCGQVSTCCVREGTVFCGGVDGGIVSFDLWE